MEKFQNISQGKNLPTKKVDLYSFQELSIEVQNKAKNACFKRFKLETEKDFKAIMSELDECFLKDGTIYTEQ